MKAMKTNLLQISYTGCSIRNYSSFISFLLSFGGWSLVPQAPHGGENEWLRNRPVPSRLVELQFGFS
ncbi:hypothetical protein DCAR_0100193 [Daucus carota subsp. sativus]|uniref:Uncharacterized protein n=1 Tax=Daucus carota subsp. sativus TaxID=79200 RepID=A0AAF0W3B4_DAUCS|nr:hypothetical protein DCAR_0100193 [Daucus carota subsp. sativus]